MCTGDGVEQVETGADVGLDDSSEGHSVRRRIRRALGEESFVAAVRRRTIGTPSDHEVERDRFEDLSELPSTPFDRTAIRTELTVFSATHVYRWVATGSSVERTRLPRSPDGA